MLEKEKYKIRPYARLLTMLGEQLIKNERIALMELIKNSYDADSAWVKISFIDFDESYRINKGSKIIIEDAGSGMTLDIIKNNWLNPATPDKIKLKAKSEKTSKGRILQGEKGIGRFAIFKLGRVITIISRAKNEDVEHHIEYDFSEYDDDFLTQNKEEKELFLEDLSVTISSQKPKTIIKEPFLLGSRKIMREPYGTRIEICNLKGSWTELKVKEVYQDIRRVQPIFNSLKNQNDFNVLIYKDKSIQNFQEEYIEKLQVLLDDRSVIKVEKGCFDSAKNVFTFTMNEKPMILRIDDPKIMGDPFFIKRFGKKGKIFYERGTSCGSFQFGFYFFDFSPKAPVKYTLDREDKDILIAHRIYLYRDNIRVYPYGDPEDDWLRIDAIRGTRSASTFLSNDQVVGYVKISQKNNAQLKDKTNREGLIEQGDATGDFIALIQTFLSYIRKGPYSKYRLDLENKKSQDIFKTEQIQKDLNELKTVIVENARAQTIIAKVEKEYKKERQYLIQRAETTEDLAGVGLSVESASHDIMGIMGKVLANLDGLLKDLIESESIDQKELFKELQSIRGGMSFIEAQLKDIQLLFKSSKQRRKSIRVKDIIEKVERIYKRLLKKENIKIEIKSLGSPLIAKTTDAVLLQLFLNLMDNAIYWLMQINTKEKKIEIVLDGNKCQLIFADNGIGVNKEDAPYIFEPFYSGKGEDGRGLGLYIARQLLERNDYSIELANVKADRILSGANFVVNFNSMEEKL